MQNLNKPWLCGLKNGMRNWVSFHCSTQSLKNCTLMGSFLSKAYNVSATTFQRNYLLWHWRMMTCVLKNVLRNLVKFHVSSRKSGNLNFHGLFLSKAYKDLDEKVQKSYVSWHWWVMQSLKKTDSWFQKWHEKSSPSNFNFSDFLLLAWSCPNSSCYSWNQESVIV